MPTYELSASKRLMNHSRVIVFANGDYSRRAVQQANINEQDLIVAVDGGAVHAMNAGLRPHVLIGDLDSLPAALQSQLLDQAVDNNTASNISPRQHLPVKCVSFPSEKDSSDLELALEQLQQNALFERAVDEVLLLGVSGGRTDHALFNWLLLLAKPWSFTLRAIDDTVSAIVVTPSRALSSSVDPGITFSVLAATEIARGLTVTGVKYPLHNAELMPGSTLGLSNETSDTVLNVSLTEGRVLVMLNYADD